MMNYKTMLYSKQYPVRAGLFGVLVVFLAGVAIAFATGFVTPEIIKAQVVGPPCCAPLPSPTPTPVPTPVPPPPPPPPPAPAPVPPPPPPLPPPPVVPPAPPLSAVCTGAPASVSIGDTVTWNVMASGADGIYTYSWSGTDGLSGSDPSFGYEYFSAGAKSADVTVTADGETVTVSCGVTVIGASAPLSAVCSASPAHVSVGQTVTWNVVASGGSGAYSYSWFGPEGLSGNSPSVGNEYFSAGVKFGEATVVDGGETVTASCSVTVSTTPPPTPGPACTLTASPSTIAPGESSTLTWTAQNAAMFLLEPGFGMVAFAGGSVSASPSQTTTYTGTASSPAGTATCTATITVSTGGNPPSGGGGGGGSRRSGVTLDMLKLPPEAPFASVYLSQIPYTGLSLTGAGLIVYWLGLVGLVALMSYVLLFKVFPAVRSFVGRILNAARETVVVAPVAASVPPAPVAAVEVSSAPAALPEVTAAEAEDTSTYSSFHGFRSFGSAENITIDDIVKGLSRLPVADFIDSASDSVAAVATKGADMVVGGYRALVRALVARDRDAAFAALRDAVRAGESPERVMTQAVCALDDVYRSRVDGAVCDPELQETCAPCDTKELEHMVSSLTTAVDASYSTGVTGAKLALVRALDTAK